MNFFVSIAAYRDPELVPTIQDCVAKARYPHQVRIVVCWQHGPDERIDFFPWDGRVEFLDFHWRDSKGTCWARAEIMKLWRGEDYYLQLDSHHRFVQDWDVKLVEQMALAPSSKPLLTTYCQDYDPDTGRPVSTEPTRIDFHSFTPEGIPLYRATSLAYESRAVVPPIRARFASAHFLFVAGSFVREVEYDPSLYFHGEEISLAVRAYSCGYDLFHPSEAIVFHRYSRDGRAKHWDDHCDDASVDQPWYKRDQLSRKRVAELLRERPVGRFAFGTDRTVEQYEAYSGINFRTGMIQDYTLSGGEPPNPTGAKWLRTGPSHQIVIQLERSRLSKTAAMCAMTWHFAIRDVTGVPVHEFSLSREVVNDILADPSPLILIQLTLESSMVPNRWELAFLDAESRATDMMSGLVDITLNA
jgi:hypothetical protein